ncbi:restriction endonuclease [Streptomyces cinereoruber]|uniref:restriction endonuclease n=1 Tax=Streptomyces cinereoruber TaxID=67260 RepID=UPI0036316167
MTAVFSPAANRIPACNRIPSRNARRSAVRPPPSGYLIPPAYHRDHELSPPDVNPKTSVVLVTNGRFTRPAREFARSQRLHLVDRAVLAEWASGTSPLWDLLPHLPTPPRPRWGNPRVLTDPTHQRY